MRKSVLDSYLKFYLLLILKDKSPWTAINKFYVTQIQIKVFKNKNKQQITTPSQSSESFCVIFNNNTPTTILNNQNYGVLNIDFVSRFYVDDRCCYSTFL